MVILLVDLIENVLHPNQLANNLSDAGVNDTNKCFKKGHDPILLYKQLILHPKFTKIKPILKRILNHPNNHNKCIKCEKK